MRKLLLALVVLAVSFAPAYANTDMTANMTTDNHYQLYISTNDNVLGTFVGQSDRWGTGEPGTWDPPYDWATAESFSTNLLSGPTNYLHILAQDQGGSYAGVLGDFTLNNANYRFDNGTQTLYTNGIDSYNSWKVYQNGWNDTPLTLIDQGANGVGPWNAISGISGNARWIWSDEKIPAGEENVTRYFSAKINAVPEPVSTVLFLVGGATLAVRRLRKGGKA